MSRVFKSVSAALLAVALLAAMPGPARPPSLQAPPAVAGASGAFQAARAPFAFVFPRDHGAHYGYQSEWWYFTGHLRDASGRRFGYELTFFRYGLRPGLIPRAPGESAWRGSQIYPAHFAITSERAGSFVHVERFAREALGMGRSSAARLDVASGPWHLDMDARGIVHMHASAGAEGIALDLEATSAKAPAIHGSGGVSRKGPCPTCASHYYSLTRMQTRGTLVSGGTRYDVGGISWMDHEFGSGELGPDQIGWDWFSVQLDDGRELMLYRLRQRDGSTTLESSGSLIERDGRVRHLGLAQFAIESTGTWTSPHSGGVYPSGWRVRVPSAGIDVRIRPAVLDQELRDAQLGIAYWEGACDVTPSLARGARGVAYVELTGYAGKLRL